jgi:hypothetical protein
MVVRMILTGRVERGEVKERRDDRGVVPSGGRSGLELETGA